ncbi:unnamed protein product [Clonostachys rosea]|uniref:GS catalytic domain-containing protein n=1 Tax=Bionectria ochroleuca TaxID=29856 RepID=A0ABY6TYL7_BIOOC|nr:unnamed protein product [Clonostachys rosea]
MEPSRIWNTAKVENFLHKYDGRFEYVRLHWVDYSGVLRTRFISVGQCIQMAQGTEKYHLAQNSLITPISTAPKEFSPSDHHETWELLPDWPTLRPCGSKGNHATVMCYIDDKGRSFQKCPRTLLEGVIDKIACTYEAVFLLKFRIEFMLLDGSAEVHKPMDRLNGYSRTAGLRTDILEIMDEIHQALRTSNIRIDEFHIGLADQVELSLAPQAPLEAIDSLVLAQETIRTVCTRHNIRATMAPKPLLNGPFNGLYLHLSAENSRSNQPANLLAGILGSMGSLCAFGMANFDSYVRAVNGCAGEWIGFGTGNRDLPVRQVSIEHWEFRMLDSTANPYLFAYALLMAGQYGVVNGMQLEWKDCSSFPSLLDICQRADYGLTSRMPSSLQEALDHLREDSVMQFILPHSFLEWYISLKKKEVEEFAKMTDEQRRLRFLEYF